MFHFIFFLVIILSSLPLKADAIWVWPRAYAQQGPNPFNGEIFVLQGRFSKRNKFERLGPAQHSWKVQGLHLVYRLEGPANVKRILSIFESQAKAWRSFGVKILGIQLDYDSPTSKIHGYVQTLNELRKELPATYLLSATGLADWINGQGEQLNKLHTVEIAFQLYQGSKAHVQTETYLRYLSRWKSPFRIGLLPSQNSERLSSLKLNPNFRGIIRFQGGRP